MGIVDEIMAFVQAVVSGMIVYSSYFCLRKLRKIIPHKLVAISIEDGLFWFVVSIYLFVQIYYTSNGSIRWYFVLGVVFGVLFLHILNRCVEKSTKKNKICGKY